MKALLLMFAVFNYCSFSVSAQFQQSYTPANWSTVNTAGANGSVNTAGAPASIVITGSNGASLSNADIKYTIPAIAAGVWSFSWTYHTNDTDNDPQYDPAGVSINGVFTQLTSNTGGVNQSGTYTGASVSKNTVIGFLIRATDNLFGTATFTITSFSPPGGVLPVSLLSFTATSLSTGVQLDWRTATEINNDRFEVEHASGNNQFGLLTTVKAVGNTSLPQHYTVHDKNPFAGVNYYRLRQVDNDGKFNYSAVVTAKATFNGTLLLYPNPAVNNITLQWNALTSYEGTACLYNAAGNLLQRRQVAIKPGNNNIEWNTKSLASGQYYFTINNTTLPFIVKSNN